MRVGPFIRRVNVAAENNAAFGFARGFSRTNHIAGAPLRKKRVQQRLIQQKFAYHKQQRQKGQYECRNVERGAQRRDGVKAAQNQQHSRNHHENDIEQHPAHKRFGVQFKFLGFHRIGDRFHRLGDICLCFAFAFFARLARPDFFTDLFNLA